MKTTLKRLITGLTLLTLATLNFQLSTAFAYTNRVGVITATYTMTASGTGNWDFGSSTFGYSGNDQLQIWISGNVKYAVLGTETNLIIGNLLSSTGQESASGSYVFDSWDYTPPPDQPSHRDGAYLADPNFSPTNVCLIKSSDALGQAVGTGQFLGTCERAAWGGIWGGQFALNDDGWRSCDNYPPYDAYGGWFCTVHGEYKVRDFQFAITNAAVHWTQSLTTNVALNYPLVESDGSSSASGTANNTITLEYVPDQLTVAFAADPTNGPVPLTVHFSSAKVDSGTTTIASWQWNFGDGLTSTAQNPSHTYTNTGTFSVTLTATNVNGTAVQGIGSSNITVSLPTVQFTVTPTNGFMPLVVYFTCPAVDSADNPIVSWHWDFGDNTSFTDQSPDQPVSMSHIYTQIKTFSPKLTVTNIWGTQITTNGPKVVVSPPPIFFTASPTNGLVPMPVQFNGPGKDSQTNAITSWNWNFGDGSIASGQSPAHTYAHVGIFSPTLLVTNNHGTAIVAFGPRISAGCSVVYAFGGGGAGFDPASHNMTNSDGIHPRAALTVSGNRFYGVMSGGGNGGSGTIFAANTDGSGFTNLYNFSALAMMWYTNGDGVWPMARLVLSGNKLYGAASSGGTGGGTSFMGEGTLFKINTNGSGFATLFNFPDGSGGGTIPNGLVLSSNTLYGTTASGGSAYNGTVFKIATDGSGFTRIHDFSASAYDPSSGSQTNGDGAYPQAALVLSANTLYGTASGGGSGGGGTVFKLGTNGLGFAVLHNFTNSDGSVPSAELMLSSNTLYGTTESGGSGNAGTVFKIGTNGTGFGTLHVFPATVFDGTANYTNGDGAEPYGGLILSGGMLYGTTEAGGSGGSGTIFAINMDGSGFTNLYNFSALDPITRTNFDGANPYAGLALSGKTVYATAFNGGYAGDGAIFALSLAAAPPWLDIQRGGNAMVISWLSSVTGYSLQQNTNLSTTNWTAFGGTVSSNGTTMSVTNSSPTGNLFFRLMQP
jgi:uncharacterized repeat protein (TIGR03803 family)